MDTYIEMQDRRTNGQTTPKNTVNLYYIIRGDTIRIKHHKAIRRHLLMQNVSIPKS